MTDLKLRAWHKEARKMLYSTTLHMNYQSGLGDGYYVMPVAFRLDGFIAEKVVEYGEDGEPDTVESLLEYMRPTGLEDLHGNEIYEGDIVKFPHGTGVIAWRDAGFYGVVGKEAILLLKSGTDNREVIGNIYEHPELLESTV